MSIATSVLAGRAWVFGDRVDTDLLAPGYAIRKPIEELAKHCLEAVRPEFSRDVARGDILVGGDGFGIGSSREQAAQALRYLGVSVVIAKSVARIFYRNAFNLGLPVMIVPDAGQIADGARLEVDLTAGVVRDTTAGRELRGEAVPDFLLGIVADGGLIPNLHKRLHGKPAA